MTYTNEDHANALKAAREGTANDFQKAKLREAAEQAGSRGSEAGRALEGK